MQQEELSKLQTLLNSAQNILILTGRDADQDSLGAGLALHLALVRLGKSVSVVNPESPTVGLSKLVGIDKVQSDLGGQNLVISFPYTEGSIDKVSYNIEGEKFNLVIQPRPGSQPISPQSVKFSQGGLNAELIIILGVADPIALGHIYEKEKDLFGKIPLVVIDNDSQNQHYGQINLIDPRASSISEMTGEIMAKLGFDLDPDMAHNLLAGLEFATHNFSSSVTTPAAFEIAATCLRAGARRQAAPADTFGGKSTFIPQPLKKPTPKNQAQDLTGEETPSDWLTPKIYKGSTLT